MKRVLTCLIMLLWLLSVVKAQTVSRYEYWTDDNYADRTTVEATGSEVTLSVSTEQLAAGIHFLNFRAVRDDGVWGNYHRYLYYIPTLNSTSARSVAVDAEALSSVGSKASPCGAVAQFTARNVNKASGSGSSATSRSGSYTPT